jgi:endonuclease/exonuclease/phosphatase family metal-dependent hydrolase
MAYPDRPRTHDSAWEFLLQQLSPDIALVQEAVVPDGTGYEVEFQTGWDHRPWGSAVLSRVAELDAVRRDSDLGAVVVARTMLPEIGQTTIASIHARVIDRRVIPGLRTILDRIASASSGHSLIGGDFNTARAAATAWPENGHGDFWSALDESELRDCYFSLHGAERQSYWREWNRNTPPTIGNSLMDDHILVDEGVYQQVKMCTIWDTRQVRELSDHGPVVVDL